MLSDAMENEARRAARAYDSTRGAFAEFVKRIGDFQGGAASYPRFTMTPDLDNDRVVIRFAGMLITAHHSVRRKADRSTVGTVRFYRHSAMDVSEIEIFGGFDIDVNGHSSIPADDGDGFFHLAGGAQAILAFILKQSVLEESP